ncbi:fungal-specific transcription factor domain-containing protein [Lentinula aff. lateritia]|uniref:Fungal-specific transcription factor domain-containing protein n=1 Tax=Lentinula aff. lateritia TaxID=2804960 RepID=A0ACC1U7Y5_9AGAR|nr:fungal-specific transcription factor domain-containing protein [Lentinula aff. lateritia]
MPAISTTGDSATRPENICTNCLKEDISCTHAIGKKKRGPRTGTSIRKHAASVHAIIGAVIAEPETYAVPEDPNVVRKMLLDLSYHARSLERQVSRWKQAATQQGTPAPVYPAVETSFNILGYQESANDSDGFDSDSSLSESDTNLLSGSLREIKIITGGKEDPVVRHYGKTSNITMMKTAVRIKKEILGDQMQLPSCNGHEGEKLLQRQEFWNLYPWQLEGEERQPLTFPENDLLCELVTSYFTYLQPYIPLLHRPSFEGAVSEGLHFRDPKFGTVLLGVCAVASRFSEDPRNLAEGAGAKYSLGWPWYKQTLPMRTTFAKAPTLYDLQTCCLSAMYLMGTSASDSMWTIVGLGIRIAQDMGLHRKKKRRPEGPLNWRTLKSELCTRAFWVLLNFDVILSLSFGRPRATSSEDFDLEWPMECDDEYWENENPEQPTGVPSRISFFVHYCKLLEILGFAQRTLYPTNKSKSGKHMGVGWEQNVVIELDSALNQWSSSVPEYLKWDSSREDGLFFRQSAALITFYYWTQMQIHGQFLREFSGKNGYSLPPPSSPAMTICANAARCCVRVIEVQRRHQFQFPVILIVPVFSTAIILLLCSWTKRKTESPSNINKEMQEINCCLDVISTYERIYQTAGRLHDILRSVITMGDQHFQDNGANPGTSNAYSEHSTGPILQDRGSLTGNSSTSASPFSFDRDVFGPVPLYPSSDMYANKSSSNAPYSDSDLFGGPQYLQMDGVIQGGGIVAASEENWSSFMEQVDEILHSVAVGDIAERSDNITIF